MAGKNLNDAQLRARIENALLTQYSTASIDERIAAALRTNGRFNGAMTNEELELILRNIVYISFAQQKVAGRDLGLVHNVPIMQVDIQNSEADVQFVVHIHKPIRAFIQFQYTLINDPVAANKRLRLKHNSLQIKETTRRYDLKAKAALTAINVEHIAHQELGDPNSIIKDTLPPQLESYGIQGTLQQVDLELVDDRLHITLEGDFATGIGD